MDRREFLVAGAAALAAGPAWAATRKIQGPGSGPADPRHRAIARIEAESGGRLGVALHDTGTGRRFAYRGDERFAMCSTFKLLLAGAVLARVQQGSERLDRRVTIRRGDVVGGTSYDTYTAQRVGKSATVSELCRAMMVESDNGSANLMFAAIGGPPAFTRFLRQLGDAATRVDGKESLWLAGAMAPTTPLAMLGNAERLWLGSTLAPAYRTLLANWAVESRTGTRRLRAGLPRGWRAGSKSGTGDNGSCHDVAIIWPANRKPLVVASYLAGCELPSEAAQAVHARVARALVTTI